MVGGRSPVPTFETSNTRAREGFGQSRTLRLRNSARICNMLILTECH